MSTAVSLGIAALVAFILCLVFWLLHFKEGVVYCLFLCVLYVTAAIVSNPSPKTIRCTSIEQIDTLYKNDSIVGYEIIIWEESK